MILEKWRILNFNNRSTVFHAVHVVLYIYHVDVLFFIFVPFGLDVILVLIDPNSAMPIGQIHLKVLCHKGDGSQIPKLIWSTMA